MTCSARSLRVEIGSAQSDRKCAERITEFGSGDGSMGSIESKAFTFVIGTLAAIFLMVTGSTAVEPFRLRVLSDNIHHGEEIDRKLDLKRIARLIKSGQPDIMSLQEVDQNTRRTGMVDQPAELARLTNIEIVFGKNLDFEGGGYGNAVLSQSPIKKRKNHLLPVEGNGEQRGFLVVELQLPTVDESILFLATHLDHRSDEQERLASAEAERSFTVANVRRHRRFPADLG